LAVNPRLLLEFAKLHDKQGASWDLRPAVSRYRAAW